MRIAPLLSVAALLVASSAMGAPGFEHASIVSVLAVPAATSHPAHAHAASKGAPAVHTAAHPVHHRGHHRHARHVRRERVAASLGQTSPMAPHPSRNTPDQPRPARDHRTATVPRVIHGSRGSKTGPHHVLATLPSTARLAVEVQPLEARQNTAPDVVEDPVTSGRGPPRASPSAALPARRSREPFGDALLLTPPSARALSASRIAPDDPPALPALSTSTRRTGVRRAVLPVPRLIVTSTGVGPWPPPRRPHRGPGGVPISALIRR